MSDPTEVPPSMTPPPRRPAPEHLRVRVVSELRRAERTSRAPRYVIAAVAAATVAVVGTIGATQLAGRHTAIPVANPTATVASTGPTPTPSASTTTTAPAVPTLALATLSKAETAEDLASCTKPDGMGTMEHRGTYRAFLAQRVPVVDVPSGSKQDSFRLLLVADDIGTFVCVDGASSEWSRSTEADLRRPTTQYPAAEFNGIGYEMSCDLAAHEGIRSEGVTWAVNDDVKRARFTVTPQGQPTRTVDLTPAGGFITTWMKLTGPSGWGPASWSVQFLDDQDQPVRVDSARNRGTPAPTTVTRDSGMDCAASAERTQGRKKIERPKTDVAGVAACRSAVKQHVEAEGDSFDADGAKVALTVSTAKAWGAILADGDRYVACSRFPTREISAVRGPSDTFTPTAFHWAQNPIASGGESFWAAGSMPTMQSVTYRLPDGQQVAAKVSKAGYWMAMASTTTAFDTEENQADWAPVQVTAVTTFGARKTYELPWNEKTSCNQVSHGC